MDLNFGRSHNIINILTFFQHLSPVLIYTIRIHFRTFFIMFSCTLIVNFYRRRNASVKMFVNNKVLNYRLGSEEEEKNGWVCIPKLIRTAG